MDNTSIDPAQPPDREEVLARFAGDLRQLRLNAGLTYEALAKRAYSSRTTLHNADSGKIFPTLGVTLQYVSACGGDVAAWRRRWEETKSVVKPGRVRVRMRRRVAAQEPQQRSDPPEPTVVTSADEFLQTMEQLRLWAGKSYRAIDARTEELGNRVPASTLNDMLTKRAQLPSETTLVSFLHACEVHDQTQVRRWTDARLNLILRAEGARARHTPAAQPRQPDGGTAATASPWAARATAAVDETGNPTISFVTDDIVTDEPRRLGRKIMAVVMILILLALMCGGPGWLW